MKRYFAVSDLHGFYDEFIAALSREHFDLDNPDHILIVLGDIFDRGRKPLQIYRFLSDLPASRRILIRGNHEYLLRDLLRKRYPDSHDITNGTYSTLVDLFNEKIEIAKEYEKEQKPLSDDPIAQSFYEFRKKMGAGAKSIYDNPLINGIIAWIMSDEWVNYYESPRHIFVHAFIPVDESRLGIDPYWRERPDASFEEASWLCPWEMYQRGLFELEARKGKTLVVGHWHVSDFFNHLLHPNEKDKWLEIEASNQIFLSPKAPNLIGIDACTALTHFVNVLVLDEKDM